MKKVLSLVLVVAMVLSSFSFAFAAKFEDVTGDYEEAVSVLTALGVIDGYEDGTFRPEAIVTRAQMAKLIVEILGYGDLVAGSKSNFADTQGHWADAWISLAAGRGLVIGTGDGKFTPDREVTYDEAITMVIRALGYTDASNELKNMTWPTNFKVKAAELDLLDGINSIAGRADRGGVAQLLFNALEAILVTVDTDGNVVYVKDANKEDKPLLSRLAEKDDDFDVLAAYIDPENKNYKGDVVDLVPYMYQNITVYEKDDVIVYVKGVNSLVIEGTVTAIDEDIITIEDAEEDEYEFDTTAVADFMFNGEEVSSYDYTKLEVDEAKVTVVLKGEDGDKIKDDIKVLAVVATQASGTIRVEDTYVKDELTLDVIYLPKDGKVVDTDNLVIKGDADSLEDIKEDDVLSIFVPLKSGADSYFDRSAANKMTIVVARETVEGRITKVSSDDYYIDGTAYELNVDGPTLKAGDIGTFFLDHEGKIFDFDKEGSGKPGNYALVLDTTDGYQTAGKVVLADPKVKLLTASGEEITYVIDFESDDVKRVEPNGQDIVVDYAKGDLVEYDLNSSKEIDELKLKGKGSLETIKTNVNSFNLASNAVIFSVPDGDYDDAEVVTVDDLDEKSIKGYRVVVNSEIVVLIVTDGAEGATGIYGMITKDNATAYDEDEEKEVVLFIAYVDGEKVEYLRHKDASKIEKSNDIVKLTLSNGKLKDTTVVAGKFGEAVNSRVTGSIETEDEDDETFFLSDDVVIYLMKTTGAFDKVGAKSDIRGREFIAYDTVDNDGDYDIIVVYPGGVTQGVDKTELNALLVQVDKLVEEDYTEASWTALQAEVVKAEKAETETEVKAAVKAVEAAIEALEDAEEAKITATFEAKYNTVAEKYAVAIDLSDVTMNDKVETVTIDGTEYEISTVLEGRLLINGSFDAVPSEVVLVVDGEPITATNAK